MTLEHVARSYDTQFRCTRNSEHVAPGPPGFGACVNEVCANRSVLVGVELGNGGPRCEVCGDPIPLS